MAMNREAIKDILKVMWGGGLDWASSDDFRELREGDDVEAADEAYLTYQNNLVEICLQRLETQFELAQKANHG